MVGLAKEYPGETTAVLISGLWRDEKASLPILHENVPNHGIPSPDQACIIATIATTPKSGIVHNTPAFFEKHTILHYNLLYNLL